MAETSAGLLYGTLAVGALLAAESARRETYAKTIAAVVITLVLYWLAHSYAEFTGRRLANKEPFEFSGLVQTFVRELSILIGASIPLLVLLIWWAAGGSLTAAVGAAIWTSASMIVLIELVAGLRAQASGSELLKQAAFGAVLGLGVIALRVILH